MLSRVTPARPTAYVALLRAVNLAGRNPVRMAELRELPAALGFSEARTLLQSGNLLFQGPARKPVTVERELHGLARTELGIETDFFVRTAEEWEELVAKNPFPKEARADPGHLLVAPLSGAPGQNAVQALKEAITGREVFRVHGRTAYFVYPDGVGRSRLTMALIERKLGLRGTGRNWNTTLKIAAALREAQS